MDILGISAFYHDSAACLLRDGKVVAAAQEERFTRIKHDSSFPTRAIEFCLEVGKTEGKALGGVAFYEKPILKLASESPAMALKFLPHPLHPPPPPLLLNFYWGQVQLYVSWHSAPSSPFFSAALVGVLAGQP